MTGSECNVRASHEDLGEGLVRFFWRMGDLMTIAGREEGREEARFREGWDGAEVLVPIGLERKESVFCCSCMLIDRFWSSALPPHEAQIQLASDGETALPEPQIVLPAPILITTRAALRSDIQRFYAQQRYCQK